MPSHPRLLVTDPPIEGLRSLEEVRHAIETDHSGGLWRALRAKVDRESAQDPWTPETPLAQRPAGAIKHADREYPLVGMTANRIRDGALVALVTGERTFAEAALAQVECLFDEAAWPKIEAISHLRHGDHCSLRRGQLAAALGLAWDWLHGLLTGAERERFLAGFDARFTDAFRVAHEAGDRFTRMGNNFVPVIYGGFGIAALAFGDEYAHGQWLLGMCRPKMDAYAADLFGPEGEFPETVQYAGSTATLANYLAAERYAAGGGAEPFSRCGFDRFARWYIHCTLAPGRAIGFGDTTADHPAAVYHLAAVAAARGDPVLQWFYLQYANRQLVTHRQLGPELLYFDPEVPTESPEGVLPRGRAFGAIAQIAVSRSSWDPEAPVSVVYGKADLEHNHAHADWGQVCVDGYGQRLVVDLGSTSPGYPMGHKGAHYNYQQLGHNVLTVGRAATGGTPLDERDRHGRLVGATFDQERGGTWTVDLTDVYEGARRVTRRVVHLLPRVAAVLDEAELDVAQPVALRWHTGAEPELADDGTFSCEVGPAALAAWAGRLDGEAAGSVEHHAHQPPNDRDRRGEPLDDPHEPFVKLAAETDRCRMLTLLCIQEAHGHRRGWRCEDDGQRWSIDTPEGPVRVSLRDGDLVVSGPDGTPSVTAPAPPTGARPNQDRPRRSLSTYFPGSVSAGTSSCPGSIA